MKSPTFYLAFLVVLALFTACGSSRKAMERGNFVAAAERSSRELCSRTKDKESSANVLRQSYPLAMQDLNLKIKAALSSNNPLRWEEVIGYYTIANNLANNIMRCPEATAIVGTPQRFDTELQNATTQAALAHCQMGQEKLATRRRDLAPQAMQHFQKAQQYNASACPDVINKIEEARLLGIMKVLVQQMPVQGVYQPSDEFFRNQINSFIVTLRKPNRLDFYFDALSIPMRLMPNQTIRFQFYDFTIGETTNRERIETVTDSVQQHDHTGGDLRLPKIPVRAELRTFEKSVRSTAILEMKITDDENRVLVHDRFPSEYIWQSTWGTYQGDNRALKPYHVELCNRREQAVPDRQTLFTEMCKPLVEQVKLKLQEFYRDK
ncbi:MAG: hypothetical protein NZ551_10530 [Microscillaceae bacterium]|nr:hypothetical protein [Microscillaceae bacterium]MDW8461634.1 hypothetical protein [Cytophagales bacterium]